MCGAFLYLNGSFPVYVKSHESKKCITGIFGWVSTKIEIRRQRFRERQTKHSSLQASEDEMVGG